MAILREMYSRIWNDLRSQPSSLLLSGTSDDMWQDLFLINKQIIF